MLHGAGLLAQASESVRHVHRHLERRRHQVLVARLQAEPEVAVHGERRGADGLLERLPELAKAPVPNLEMLGLAKAPPDLVIERTYAEPVGHLDEALSPRA